MGHTQHTGDGSSTVAAPFNALAAFDLRQELGHDHVYRLSPHSPLLDLVPRYAEGRILFSRDLRFPELERRFDSGAHPSTRPADDAVPAPSMAFDRRQLLFTISARGRLAIASADEWLGPSSGTSGIWLIESPSLGDNGRAHARERRPSAAASVGEDDRP